MACPTVTREEIVNACGVDDIHDGEHLQHCRANVLVTPCSSAGLLPTSVVRTDLLSDCLALDQCCPCLHALAGVNYVRTACVIAVSKSKDIFEPLIHQVGGLRLASHS
jgi:hypothetical protein